MLMFHAVGGLKHQVVLVGGSSLFLVFLITLYSMNLVEDNTITGDQSISVDIDNDSSIDLAKGSMGSMTTPTLIITTTPQTIEVSTLSQAQQDASNCRKVLMVIAKRLMKHLNKCNKKLKEQYPDKEAFTLHYQCTLKCFMTTVKLIDSNDQMTNETMSAFVDEQIPERFRDLVYRLGRKCIDTYAYKLEAQDEYCKSYGDFIKCLQNEAADRC